MSSFRKLENNQLSDHKQSKEINLAEVFIVIRRYVWVIILITIMSTTAGAYYSNATYSPLYKSTARIIIGADSSLIATLKVIIQDSTVLEKVVQKLDLPYSPEVLSGKIEVSSIADSQVVTISVLDSDPKQAAILANEVAETYKQEIPKILDFNDVKLLSEAKEIPIPVNQDKNRMLIISLIGGIVIGIGLAFLLDSLNNSVRKEYEVEEMLGLPVLGTVSKMKKKNMQKKKRITRFENRSESLGS
ncbi:capsular polysaccharide biosynthesis protein [Metabacillus crassostreae]|uniref:YveK family protein n=1 Tax=Metabacillus crassostreae TaxID=929098 RepID=UPI00195C4473|nr:Wzz/FepE/Etk N-terminal domain-containing protein [Metabacillus crassostreae]MBM7604662.1 capsular polysaccharide biosynthesis protein [Metabacillus crassostreae]